MTRVQGDLKLLNVMGHSRVGEVYPNSDHVRRVPWSPGQSGICPAVIRDGWRCPSGGGHARGQSRTSRRWLVAVSVAVRMGWPGPPPSGCRDSWPSIALFSDKQKKSIKENGYWQLEMDDQRPKQAIVSSHQEGHLLLRWDANLHSKLWLLYVTLSITGKFSFHVHQNTWGKPCLRSRERLNTHS